MKITYFSDIHEEFKRFDTSLVKPGEVCVVAGDLAPLHSRFGIETLNLLAKKFEHIIYVAGNHEFYNGDISDLPLNLAENVHYLNNESIKIKDVTFIGCTLWTSFEHNLALVDRAGIIMNDYRAIKDFEFKLHPRVVYQKHLDSVEYLYDTVKKTAGPTVVITHHAPHKKSVHGIFRNSPNNHLYHSNLDFILAWADIWIHGHTHKSRDYEVCGCRVLCNPRGYADTSDLNLKFNPNKTVTIDGDN